MSTRLLQAQERAALTAAPVLCVGEEPAAELGERPLGLLEDGEDRFALGDRKRDDRDLPIEAVGDDRRGGLGESPPSASRAACHGIGRVPPPSTQSAR